jgi:hypothetical protein
MEVIQVLLLLLAVVSAMAAAAGISWGRCNFVGLFFYFFDLLLGAVPGLKH